MNDDLRLFHTVLLQAIICIDNKKYDSARGMIKDLISYCQSNIRPGLIDFRMETIDHIISSNGRDIHVIDGDGSRFLVRRIIPNQIQIVEKSDHVRKTKRHGLISRIRMALFGISAKDLFEDA